MLTKYVKCLQTVTHTHTHTHIESSNILGLVGIYKNNIEEVYKASYVVKLHSWLF